MAHERLLVVLACVLVYIVLDHHLILAQTSEIVIAPEAQTNARIGDTVLFTCVSVTYDDAVSTISWSRGDNAVLNDSQRIAIFEKEINFEDCGVTFAYSILEICNVASVDASDGYTCSAASNGTNVDNATFEFQPCNSSCLTGDNGLSKCTGIGSEDCCNVYRPNEMGVSICALTCSDGYEADPPDFICERRCPVLDDPTNGNVSYPNRTVGSLAIYTCNGLFEIAGGDEMRVCQNDSTWDGTAAVCSALCLDPPVLVNGMRTSTGNSVGDTANYTCNTGFELIGNPTTTCTAATDGNSATFPALPPPECRPLCLGPPALANGMRTFTGNSVDDTANYTCNTGFELIGNSTTTCTAATDGNSAMFPAVPPPECRPLCPNPPTLVNGMRTFTGNSVGDTANYTCNTGFELIGNPTTTCTEATDGNSAMFPAVLPPECRPLCPGPPTLVNGMRSFTGNSVGDTANYTCNTGFELIGNPTTTCTAAADGNSATFPAIPPPECRPLCPDPPALANGMRTLTGNSVRDTANYTCNTGFELIGNQTTTCTATAVGNSATFPAVQPPECSPLCPNPPALVNSIRTFTGNSVGDTATYTCNPGFELVGNQTTTCTVAVDGNSATFPAVPLPECRLKNCTEDENCTIEVIEEIANAEITQENVEDVTQITSKIAEDISDIEKQQTPKNLKVVINVIIGITNITDSNITEQTTKSVVMIVDAVQNWSDAVVEVQSSLIIQTFESFASQLVQQQDFLNITVIAGETLLQAYSVSTKELQVLGITLSVPSTMFGEEVDDTQPLVSVVLPPSLFRQIIQEANSTRNDGIDFTGIVVTLYEMAVLFPIAIDPIEESFIEIGTPVVGADIAGLDVINLTEPFTIKLRLNNASSKNPKCVSYDFNALGEGIGNWTTEGCTTVNVSLGVVECECDHLTNFGALVDISDRSGDGNLLPPAAKTALSAISIVGSIFSLIGCALTVATQLGFKKLRDRAVSKFHAQLSIAIFGMMITFVAGIEQTQSIGGCVTVSLLVHYFSMASVMWMAAEAWLMFQKFVIVFVQITTRYIVTVSLICWLIPIPFVIVPVAVDHNFVINEDYCFISNIGVFFGAYFGPVLVLIVFNTIIFIIVIAVLIKHTRRSFKTKDSSSLKITIQNVISMIGIMFLFGLTWLFGAFTVTQKTELAFLILFILFSSFQGFFIFVFLCVINKDARELWIQFLTRGRRSKKANISGDRLALHKYYITANSTPKYSSDQYPTQKNRDPYDDRTIEIKMYHTTDEAAAVCLKEGAPDIDTELATNTL